MNGKTGEVLRWILGLALAAVVSYYTTIGTMQTRQAVSEAKIEMLQRDVSELRSDVKLILQAVR